MDYLSFKIFDRLYCIGDKGASSYIIETSDGLVMVDTGYLEGCDRLIESMEKLGLSLFSLRHIIHTHGHIDHFGATKKLVSLTHAKTYLGAPDRAAANGEKELSFAKELGMEFKEYFEPDILLYDGDVLSFGDINIKCVATPGHTEGAFSFFFTLEGKKIGIHGGAGLNTLVSEYLDKMELPYGLRMDYLDSTEKLKHEQVDVFLGNHIGHNNTYEKYERLMAGDGEAFVDGREWGIFLDSCREKLIALMEKEDK
ncbi:MAG: MBL fold metallo-hydrolase [Clostridia bacterium]|nr:MBL fold metallo-hydrolase [Clostridia bacterium]